MKKEMPDWGRRARQAMKAKGITFKDMALELGLSESMVSRQTSGVRNVNMRQIRIYSKVLDMSLSELVGDDAVFVTDEQQLKAVELIKEIPEDRRDWALKMLQAMADKPNSED